VKKKGKKEALFIENKASYYGIKNIGRRIFICLFLVQGSTLFIVI